MGLFKRKKQNKEIDYKFLEDHLEQDKFVEIPMALDSLYALAEDINVLQILRERQDKNKEYVELLKKYIRQKKFTLMQTYVITLRLGYTTTTFRKKYYIGPRTNAQIAAMLKISKPMVTKHLSRIRERISNIIKNRG
jgi:hypothetical protein